MNRPKAWPYLLALALVANLALAAGPRASEAHACSCAGAPTGEEALRTYDAVFSGKVVGVAEDELTPGVGPSLGKIVFDAERTWKGVSAGPISFYGYGDEVSCGIPFEKGSGYLVYAYRTDKGTESYLETGLCEGTELLSTAPEDLAELGPPADVLPDTGGPATPLRLATGAAVSLAAAAVAFLLAVRRD